MKQSCWAVKRGGGLHTASPAGDTGSRTVFGQDADGIPIRRRANPCCRTAGIYSAGSAGWARARRQCRDALYTAAKSSCAKGGRAWEKEKAWLVDYAYLRIGGCGIEAQ
ncbi:MAG: hypothetical protein ACLSB9_00030 [Hydrogeniiclostridium mannosilyticum]